MLKRLELNGFKSFAGKTVLEFPKGVTAIVGPNGSGKSNIIDAIRWLLGERDAKSLRGGTITDLIFGGTAGKARVGLASSALTFDNSSRFFPVDFDEVEIKRQITRDGNSSYFLNKSEVRLKDLVEFLAQSRLGTKGLIVVSQGNSDLFIKASPAERREMIEEILGLREFRLKRQEAERKLKNTQMNMETVRVQTEELKPHLKWLKKQTVKWERRAEAEGELKKLENRYFGARAAAAGDAYLRLDPELDRIEREIAVMRQEQAAREKELAAIEAAEPENRKKLKEVRERRAAVSEEERKILKQMEETEREIKGRESVAAPEVKDELMAKAWNELYQAAKEALSGVLTLTAARGILGKIIAWGEKLAVSERGAVAGEKRKADEMKQKVAVKFNEMRKEAGRLEEEMNQIEKSLERFTAEFKEAFRRVEEQKEKTARMEQERERVKLEKERREFKIEELKKAMAQAGRKWEEFAGGREEEMTEEEERETERKLFSLRGELAAIGEIDTALVAEYKETESRHAFLEKQLGDLKTATTDISGMLEELAQTIHERFNESLGRINKEFNSFFNTMFAGGKAELILERPRLAGEGEEEEMATDSLSGGAAALETISKKFRDIEAGVDIKINLPKKKVAGTDALSGGERSLVSVAALFAMISVSPPPFLVLDEIDAPLDETNARRFGTMIKEWRDRVQFVVVTHNRATMEAADVLYGVTLGKDGASKIVSLKLT